MLLKGLDFDGLPYGCNVLLTGLPGIGKSVFCQTLTGECLREESNVIYITLDASPKEIKNKVLGQGSDGSKESRFLTVVDGYSWMLGEVNEKYHVSHLSNMNDLSVRIFNAMNDGGGRCHKIIFDSVSTLFAYNSDTEVIRFLQVNMARVKQGDSIAFWTIQEGIHSPSFYNFLRHLADGVLEMRFEDDRELKRFIRVHTFKGVAHKTTWYPFTIQDKGGFRINHE